MLDVRELQRRAGAYRPEEFERRYRGLFFVGAMEPLPAESDHTFEQGTTLRDFDAVTRRNARGSASDYEVPFVLRIRKTERNHATHHISVGRAANNDVILLHPTVSKLHALLVVEPDTEGLRLGRLLLQDAGSSNGTQVNGIAAQPLGRSATPIAPGDQIVFGHVTCTLVDARTLRKWVQRLEPL